MKTLKICFFLFGLLFIANGKAEAQRVCLEPVSITSVPEEVSLNADNSISIPITIGITTGNCHLSLKVKVTEVKTGKEFSLHEISAVPTREFQTTITIPNTSVNTEYLVRCGSVEHGFNDGGCTIIVVP